MTEVSFNDGFSLGLDGSTPAVTGEIPESTSAGEEVVAASLETPATETETKEQEVEVEVASDPDTDSSKGTSTELDKLIASKGGAEKFAESVHATYKQLKEMRRELEEFKSKSATPEVKQEEQVAPEPNPDIDFLKTAVQDCDRRIESANRQRAEAATEHNSLSLQLAKLEGKLEDADDYKKVTITNQITSLKAEMKAEVARYNASIEKLEDLGLKKQELGVSLKRAESNEKYLASQRAAEEANNKALASTYSQQYKDAVEKAIDEYALEGDVEAYYRNIIKHEVNAALAKATGPIDFQEVIAARSKAFATALGIGKQAKAAVTNVAKAQAAGKLQTPPNKVVTPGSKSTTITKAQMLADAKKWEMTGTF